MDQTVTFFLGVGVFFYLITCIAVLDIATKDFGGMEKKLLWGFISLLPFIGCIIYFLVGYRKGTRQQCAVQGNRMKR